MIIPERSPILGSEKHFRSVCDIEVASILFRAIQEGTQEARKIVIKNGCEQKRTEPTLAHDLSIKNLNENLLINPNCGIIKMERKEQIFWGIGPYAIRIKKHSRGYKTSNHPSLQQEAIQYQLPLDGILPRIYLTAGPRFSQTTGLVEEYVIVYSYYHNREHIVEWVVDLEELTQGDIFSKTQTLPYEIKDADIVRKGYQSKTNSL